MARRRKREQPTQYLPGATWRDVLAGRPVTQEEAAKAKQRKGKCPMRCESCRAIEMAKDQRLVKPCRKCGGRLSRIS